MNGRDGLPGNDGTDIEFIYKRTDVYVAPDTPVSVQEDDNVPEGWDDNPSGISEQFQFEWFAVRFKNDGVWSDYTSPVL